MSSRPDHHIYTSTLDSQFTENPMRDDVPYPLMPEKASSRGGLGYGTFVSDYDEPESECEPTQAFTRAANILVVEPPCDEMEIAGDTVVVYDPMGCNFDHDEAELDGVKIAFGWGTIKNPYYDNAETIPDPEDPEGPEIENPCYDPRPFLCVRTAINRCCVDADTGA